MVKNKILIQRKICKVFTEPIRYLLPMGLLESLLTLHYWVSNSDDEIWVQLVVNHILDLPQAVLKGRVFEKENPFIFKRIFDLWTIRDHYGLNFWENPLVTELNGLASRGVLKIMQRKSLQKKREKTESTHNCLWNRLLLGT